jgi:hypothetical protein
VMRILPCIDANKRGRCETSNGCHGQAAQPFGRANFLNRTVANARMADSLRSLAVAPDPVFTSRRLRRARR